MKNMLRIVKKYLILMKICKKPFHVLLTLLLSKFDFWSATFFIFEMRNKTRIKVRKSGYDIAAITEVFIESGYEKSFEIKKGDKIIDIGAHVGTFSIYAANKGATIYSFEPSKENFRLLRENIKLNRFYDEIKPFNFAVSGKRGQRVLYLSHSSLGHSLFNFGNRIRKEMVKSITLEDVFEINGLSSCDFLKMDAEGCEYEILSSSKKETLEKIKKLVVEYHISAKKGLKLMNFLIKNGFNAEMVPFKGNIGMIYGHRAE